MDSLTHIVLGAATGQVVLGKKMGNKALLWGAIAGSIPDFDTFITPLLDPVTSLLFHRGPSHSILFAIICAPILGYLISKIRQGASFKQWSWLVLLSMTLHSTIDIFNTYGTALLWPFSSARLSFDSMSIIDILYLTPILILAIVLIFKPKQSKARQKLAIGILAFTFVFVTLSVGNKLIVDKRIKYQLNEKGIEYSRFKTAPLPLTNFLWLVLAEDSLGYHYGYISSFDKRPVDFKYIYRNKELLGEYKYSTQVGRLIEFTKGYFTLSSIDSGSVCLYDLRFGSMAFEDDKWYVFSFHISGDKMNPVISREHPNRSFNLENIMAYYKRVVLYK